MIDRIELKNRAKKQLRAALGVLLLTAVLWYLATLSFFQYAIDTEKWTVTLLVFDSPVLTMALDQGRGVIQKLGLSFIVYTILILYPLEYGFKNLYLRSLRGSAELKSLLDGFKEGYSRIMTVFVFRDLLIFLWSCLLIVPGIMKAYSYRFVPYLAKEHPEMSPMEILRLSSEMTAGYRWQIFVLDLSFVGWEIVKSLTMGLSGLLSNPYYQLTDAALYQTLKRERAFGAEQS